jgi:hypothetical protein
MMTLAAATSGSSFGCLAGRSVMVYLLSCHFCWCNRVSRCLARPTAVTGNSYWKSASPAGVADGVVRLMLLLVLLLHCCHCCHWRSRFGY